MANDESWQSCSTCKFWRFYVKRPSGAEQGRCNRYPPPQSKVGEDGTTKDGCLHDSWPTTLSKHWCGEFQGSSASPILTSDDQGIPSDMEGVVEAYVLLDENGAYIEGEANAEDLKKILERVDRIITG